MAGVYEPARSVVEKRKIRHFALSSNEKVFVRNKGECKPVIVGVKLFHPIEENPMPKYIRQFLFLSLIVVLILGACNLPSKATSHRGTQQYIHASRVDGTSRIDAIDAFQHTHPAARTTYQYGDYFPHRCFIDKYFSCTANRCLRSGTIRQGCDHSRWDDF